MLEATILMSRTARVIRNIALLALAAFIFPMSAFASTAATHGNLTAPETVTIQVDSSAPNGAKIVGTVTIKRTPGSPTSQVIFHGTINGKPADATANATESWSGSTNDKIHVTEITSWNAAVARPGLMDIELSQAGAGLVTVNGIPLAINGSIAPPGSGDMTYMVTNPGSGEQNVGLLPQTGEGSILSDPNLLSGIMVAMGAAILILGLRLGRRAGRRIPSSRRLR